MKSINEKLALLQAKMKTDTPNYYDNRLGQWECTC